MYDPSLHKIKRSIPHSQTWRSLAEADYFERVSEPSPVFEYATHDIKLVLTPPITPSSSSRTPFVQCNLHSETNDLCRAGTLPEARFTTLDPPGYRPALGFSKVLQQWNINLVACVGISAQPEANRICWSPPQTREDTRYADEILSSRQVAIVTPDLEIPYHWNALRHCIPNSDSAWSICRSSCSIQRIKVSVL